MNILHIPGVGPKTEKMLWSHKILSWEDFGAKLRDIEISEKTVVKMEEWLELSEKALKERDAVFFSKRLPHTDLWRRYPEFKDRIAFLDIETTGLSFCYDDITLIGLYDGKETKTFI